MAQVYEQVFFLFIILGSPRWQSSQS